MVFNNLKLNILNLGGAKRAFILVKLAELWCKYELSNQSKSRWIS